jgi:hypothetical protein
VILSTIDLHLRATRAIHVLAVTTAEGDHMSTAIEENAADKPKATKKARACAPGAHVAPKKGKATKKTSPAKKAPKAAKEALAAKAGSKAARILELLKR